jgi:hypothetical protein
MPWKWIEQKQWEGVGAQCFVEPDPDHQLHTVSAFTQYQTDICLTITSCLDADYSLMSKPSVPSGKTELFDIEK